MYAMRCAFCWKVIRYVDTPLRLDICPDCIKQRQLRRNDVEETTRVVAHHCPPDSGGADGD